MKFKGFIFFSLYLAIFASTVYSQIPIKRDDFVNTSRRNWWRWHDDGPNTPLPSVLHGFVLVSLVDPIINPDPPYYCDAAFWDGYPAEGGIWSYCTITMRVKALNPHKFGSRGWGLWYTESPPNLQRQIWYMRNKDSTGTGYTGLDWWRAETSNSRYEATHHYVNLDTIPDPIDDEQWHIYKIVRDTTHIEFLIDGRQVLYVTEDLPSEELAFHLWIDNLVYEHVDPDIINYYQRAWIGRNEVVVDYVQIVTPDSTLDQSESPSGIKLLRAVPNVIYTDTIAGLWKNYFFNSPGGGLVVLATARVEQYHDSDGVAISGDDDIRLIIDGTDYGWNTSSSFNGDAAGTVSKTLVFEQSMTLGTKTVEVYGETSPLLYDVTVLGSSGGGVVYKNDFNETKTAGSAELWKEISFQTWGGDVAIYVSGTADEDPNPTNYGYRYSEFDDNNDDDLKIVIDGTDYGYQNANAFWGNRLFGEPKSVLIIQNLSQGSHTLRLFGQGTPTLYSVVIYGANDDSPLPVTYTAFNVETEADKNIIKWETASELNNLGFDLYKAFNESGNLQNLSFSKLNLELIEGKGNASYGSEYTFTDKNVYLPGYYWYYLEDISTTGEVSVYDTLLVKRTDEAGLKQKFTLLQNYPNPFNSRTKIKFYLEKQATIRLEIRSLSGELVRTLENNSLLAGRHSYIWDGKNNRGHDVASGLYLYSLKSNTGYRKTKKLLLIR
ncbi:MAG TPA: T9SS type A sorting domain-containing protein [Calditrichaeota bacterium]|nr:T9SS type A sorting domain-containing protein [Calditrichota bacterium]